MSSSQTNWKTCQGIQDHCPHCGAEAGSPQVVRNGTSSNFGRVYQLCTMQPDLHLWWANNVNLPAMTQATPHVGPGPQQYHHDAAPNGNQYHLSHTQPPGAFIPASQAPRIPCACGANANGKCVMHSCRSCCRKEALLRRNSEICSCQDHRAENRRAVSGVIASQQAPMPTYHAPMQQQPPTAMQSGVQASVPPPGQAISSTSRQETPVPPPMPAQNPLEPHILDSDTSPRLRQLYNRAPLAIPTAPRPKQMKMARAFKLIFLVEDGEDEIFDLSMKEGRTGSFRLQDYPREHKIISTDELRIWNASAQHWERLFVDDEKTVREGEEIFVRPTKMSRETAERLRDAYSNQKNPVGIESYRRNGISVVTPLPAVSKQPMAPPKHTSKSSLKTPSSRSTSRSQSVVPGPKTSFIRNTQVTKGSAPRKVARSNTGKWPAGERFIVVDAGFTQMRRSRSKGNQFHEEFVSIFGPVAQKTCVYAHYKTWKLAGTALRDEWRLAGDGAWVEFAAIAGTGGTISESDEDEDVSENEDEEVVELSSNDEEDESEQDRQGKLANDSFGGRRGGIQKRRFIFKESDEESDPQAESDGRRGRRLDCDVRITPPARKPPPPVVPTLASLDNYVEDDGRSFMKMMGMKWGSEDEGTAESDNSDVEMVDSTPKRPPATNSTSTRANADSPSHHLHASKRQRTNDDSAFQTLLSMTEPRNRRISGSSASSSTSEGPSASVYESHSEREEKAVTVEGEDEDELEDDDDYDYGRVDLNLGAF